MDVVNAERDEWTVDPFLGEIHDGYIYGRGTLDMKSAGILQAATLINVRRSGARLSRDLVFLGTADEEVDAAGIRWMTWEHVDFLRSAEFLLNEGGAIDEVDGRARSYNVAVTEKSPFWIRIRAEGRAGHGSQPFVEDNAVLRLLRALDRLSRYEPPIRVTDTTQAFFRALGKSTSGRRADIYADIRKSVKNPMISAALTADPAFNAILRNTIAITMLEGRAADQYHPLGGRGAPRCAAAAGRGSRGSSWRKRSKSCSGADRRNPRADRAFPGGNRVADRFGAGAPPSTGPGSATIPDAVLAPTMLTGWTESAAVRPFGVKAYGFQPFVLDESEQKRIHGDDERISVENVFQWGDAFWRRSSATCVARRFRRGARRHGRATIQ